MDKNMPVKFLEIDQERERLVFSARKAADSKQLKTYNVSFCLNLLLRAYSDFNTICLAGCIHAIHCSVASALCTWGSMQCIIAAYNTRLSVASS